MAVLNPLQPIPVTASPAGPFSSTNPSMPQIKSTTLLNASPKDRESLLEIHELLTSLFIRNRNQHRRNHWFKSLQQFRKQLGLLLQEMESAASPLADPRKGKAGRKAEAEAIRKRDEAVQRLDDRLRFWDQRCIHQWYLHFTQLVAVGPFAVLGLVLMACTARVCRITGITALYEEIGSEDMRAALKMIDEGVAEQELTAILGREGEDVMMGEEAEDLGEVVERR